MAKILRNNGASTRSFDFTFPDSGVTIKLRKVNPYIVAEARSQLNRSRPKPPTRIVTEEGPLKGTEEVMDRDPDYIEEVRKWEATVDERIMQLQIRRGVVEIKVENWKDEVQQLRDDMAEIGADKTLPTDDTVTFICYIAASTAEDLQDFIGAIAMRSQPSAEGVDAAKESFRASVEE